MQETSFGKYISEARKAKGFSQKQLSEMILREDGEPISPQYLNDIERDRRLPSSEIIREISQHLSLDADYLHLLARKIPDDLPIEKMKQSDVQNLMIAFRKKVKE